MSEIVMGVPKKSGESVFITDIGDGMLIYGKPDVARNPMTGKLEKVDAVIVTDIVTYCPKCKQANSEGIEITFLETVFVYNCRQCNQFVWCARKDRD